LDWGVWLFAGFLRLIADLGLDKKSGVFNSSGGVAPELALFLLRLVGCGGKVEGTGAVGGTSGLAFCGCFGLRLPDFPD